MSFLSITPRNKTFLDFNVKGVPLRVVQSTGIDVKPPISFTISDLNNGYKHYRNNNDKCMSFKVDILIKHNDSVLLTKEWTDFSWQDEIENFDTILASTTNASNTVYTKLGTHKPMTYFLDVIMKNMIPVKVTGDDLIDVTNDYFLIVGNDSRKQTFKKHTIWSLDFIQYKSLSYTKFKNTNKYTLKAVKKYEATKKLNQKKAKQRELAKIKSTSKWKLEHKCKYTQLVYSKKKNYVKCVVFMQDILYKKGFLKGKKSEQIDGWFGNKTKNALIAFQKKYKKKYNLPINGKVTKATFKALYSV